MRGSKWKWKSAIKPYLLASLAFFKYFVEKVSKGTVSESTTSPRNQLNSKKEKKINSEKKKGETVQQNMVHCDYIDIFL